MAEYIYKAKRTPQEMIEGVIVADTRLAAIQKIAAQGLHPLSVGEYSKDANALDIRAVLSKRSISMKELTYFTRQLSDLLGSGITIARALDMLSEQAESGAVKKMIVKVRDHCVEGNSLSEALALSPEVFPKLFISLIKSGEASGSLDEVLRRLADFNEKQLELRGKVQASLAYPVLMSAVGAITIWVLLTFVIPKITGMFSDIGQKLPLPTIILLQASSFIRNDWWLILLVGILGIGALNRYYLTKSGRRCFDSVKLNIPVAGDLIKKVEIEQFARTMATLLKNGIPALDALGIVADTIHNVIIKDDIIAAASKVKEGQGLAKSFGKRSHLPVLVINMIEVGEESGKLDEVLFKIAENYDREVSAAVKIMVSLLEPVLILVLGVVVGFIVVAMLLPIFEINFMTG